MATFTYNHLSNNKYSISKVVIGEGESDITIPYIPDIDESGIVTEIAQDVFKNNKSITTLHIPDSIIKIGANAFQGCTELTSVYYYDRSTRSASVNNWIKITFDNFASNPVSAAHKLYINNTLLTTANLSEESISAYAFFGCTSLTEVIIGSNVTSIGDGAFAKCDALTSIAVDGDNPKFKAINGNLYSKSGQRLIKYSTGKSNVQFEIPASVVNIDKYAFAQCNALTDNLPKLTSIKIPNNVQSFFAYAFEDCRQLEAVYFSKDLAKWITKRFDNHYASPLNQPHSSVNIDGKKGPKLYLNNGTSNYLLTSVTLNGTTIKKYAFYRYAHLNSATFTNVNIEYQAFAASGLTQVVFYGNNTLGTGAFGQCYRLSNGVDGIQIDDNSKMSIGPGAFNIFANGEDLIPFVRIGDSPSNAKYILNQVPSNYTGTTYAISADVEYISEDAFINIQTLSSITVNKNNPTLKSIDGNLYTKDGKMLIKYCRSHPRTAFSVPRGVETIEGSAFKSCDNLESILLPTTIKTIKNRAFANCQKLEQVVLAAEEIGERAFINCKELKLVALCSPSIPELFDSDVFKDTNSNLKFYCYPQVYTDYTSTDVWNNYRSKIVSNAIETTFILNILAQKNYFFKKDNNLINFSALK